MAISCKALDLLKAAACYSCLLPKQRSMVMLYLLCQWANKGGAAPGVPLSITIDPASVAGNTLVKWTQGVAPTTNELWRAKNGGAFALFVSVAGGTVQKADTDAMADGDIWCYEVRACNGATCSAFTAQVCAGQNLISTPTSPTLVIVYGTFRLSQLGAVSFTGLLEITADLQVTAPANVNVPALQKIGGNITANGDANLTTLTLTALQTVGGFIDLTGAAALTAWSTPLLTSIGGDAVFGSNTISLATLNCPLLATIGGSLVVINTAITTMNLNALASVTGEADFINGLWATISLPALVSVNGGGGLMFVTNANLTSIILPSLTTVATNCDWHGNPLLTSISIPNLIFTDGTTIDASGNALDAASVNLILARAVASGVSSCIIDTSGGTSAAPSGQGIIDKAILRGAGNTVTTN